MLKPSCSQQLRLGSLAHLSRTPAAYRGECSPSGFGVQATFLPLPFSKTLPARKSSRQFTQKQMGIQGVWRHTAHMRTGTGSSIKKDQQICAVQMAGNTGLHRQRLRLRLNSAAPRICVQVSAAFADLALPFWAGSCDLRETKKLRVETLSC